MGQFPEITRPLRIIFCRIGAVWTTPLSPPNSGQSGSHYHSCGGSKGKIPASVDAKGLPVCLALGAKARMYWGEWKAGREL